MEAFAIGAAGAVVGVANLFDYNREGFMFDAEQRMKREFQGQDMRVKQFEMYREDVRDLVELTVSKMDIYLIVNTLQLSFCITLFTEGRPDSGFSEPWIVWLWSITLIGGITYLTLSVWLAMHASIAAHSFGVRLLTQFVRLPVPNRKQLDAARSTAEDFEQQSLTSILRIPVLRQQMRKLASDLNRSDRRSVQRRDTAEDTTELSPAAMLKHVTLFRELQANWQAYDAYARVCMTMGTSQFLQSLGYYCLMMLIDRNRQPWPGLGCVVLFSFASWLISRLDLYLSRATLAVIAVLIAAPTLIAMVVVTCTHAFWSSSSRNNVAVYSIPFLYVSHAAWLLHMLYLAKGESSADSVMLPSKFRSVLYLDVFGWLGDKPSATRTVGHRTSWRSRNVSQSPANHEDESNRSAQRSDGTATVAPADAPAALRTAMKEACQAARDELEQDLALWEHEETKRMFTNDKRTQAAVLEIRSKFTRLCKQLDEQFPTVADTDEESNSISSMVQNTWLKMEWNPDGQALTIFHNVHTQMTQWTRPEEGRISDIHILNEQFHMITEKAESLLHLDSVPLLRQHPAQPEHEHVGEQEEESVEQPATGASHTEEESAAQVTRFGGEQAVIVDHTREGVFTPSPVAGATFLTRRTRTLQAPRTQRPPGEMPWKTFKTGTLVLVFIWVVGFVWSLDVIHTPFAPIFNSTNVSNSSPTWPSLSGGMLSLGRWPRRLSSPVDIACHPALGSNVLIAGKYGVFSFDTDGTGDSARPLVPVLEECLESKPDFVAHGIRGIGIDCVDAANCSAVVFGEASKGALRCPVHGMGAQSPVSMRVSGDYQWQALAAGDGGSLWAVSSTFLVRFGRHSRDLDNAVPEFFVPEVFGIVQLQVAGPLGVLGIDRSGNLHSWSPQGRPTGSWSVSHEGRRWRAACATPGALHFVGASKRIGHVDVWRTSLPAGLGNHDTEFGQVHVF